MNETPPADLAGAAIVSKLNWLRAGVLGANDGIISTSAIIFGVAGASASHGTLVLAGVAAIAAGAMSMAVGEYVSVSSQRDLEVAELAAEQRQIDLDPSMELDHLAILLQDRGIEPDLARKVAIQLSERDVLGAHARVELGIDPRAVVNPMAAAAASMAAFTCGGLIPLLSMVLAPRPVEVWTSGGAVLLALALSGWISAALGGAPRLVSIARTIVGGLLAMGVTYGVGRVAGTQV